MLNFCLHSDLTNERDEYTIKVQASRIRDIISFDTKKVAAINIILIDENGNQILLTLRRYQIKQYESKFEEQEVYIISNFKVAPDPTQFKKISSDKQIFLFCDTEIKHVVDNGSIPKYEFEFTPFDQVPGKLGDSTQLIDIVGKIATISRKQTLSTGVEKIDIIINDEKA